MHLPYLMNGSRLSSYWIFIIFRANSEGGKLPIAYDHVVATGSFPTQAAQKGRGLRPLPLEPLATSPRSFLPW